MDGFHHYKKVITDVSFNNIFLELKPLLKNMNKYKSYCVQAENQNGIYPIYRVNLGMKQKTFEFSPIVKKLKEKLKEYGINANYAKSVLYKSGKIGINKHSDPTVDTKIGSSFALISFGETRKFIIEDKKNNILKTLNFEHGDILIIDYEQNKKYFHSIPIEENIINPRISILFKECDTFINEEGYVFGLGSPYKTLSEAKKHKLLTKQENLEKGIKLAGIYRKQQTLEKWDYNELYGEGFFFEFMNPFLEF